MKENAALREQLTSRREEQQQTYTPKPLDISEYETRKLYIDAMLDDAGWVEGKNWINEYHIPGMPNKSEQGYADYAFIQHIIASMKEGTGRCAILLPHGILNRIVEADIRKKLVESDVIDAIISIGKNLFFNSPMEACILLCRTTKPAEKKGKILFVNARDLVVQQTGNAYLSEDHIRTIANLYNSCSNVEGRSRIVEYDEIYQAKDISLSVSLYVGKHSRNESLSVEDEIAEWDSQTRIMNNQYTNLLSMICHE